MAKRIQSTRGNPKSRQANKLEVKLRRGTGGITQVTTVTQHAASTPNGSRPSGATVVINAQGQGRARSFGPNAPDLRSVLRGVLDSREAMAMAVIQASKGKP